MRIDWNLIAQDLAKHLAAVDDERVLERILDQARTDAAGRNPPTEFWASVSAAYAGADASQSPRGEPVGYRCASTQ